MIENWVLCWNACHAEVTEKGVSGVPLDQRRSDDDLTLIERNDQRVNHSSLLVHCPESDWKNVVVTQETD